MTFDPGPAAPRVRVVRAALIVEASALLVAGLAGIAQLLTGGWSGLTLALAGAAVAVAGGLFAGQRAVQHGRPRATAPLITWQLLQGATAAAVLGAVTDL
ncbi:MAG TPA: hypothetical protein VN257_09875, partial [Actinotalea sp.]|nr:hypothetical protein [Actinotalea sp.]